MAALIDIVAFSIPKGSEGKVVFEPAPPEEKKAMFQMYMDDLLRETYYSLVEAHPDLKEKFNLLQDSAFRMEAIQYSDEEMVLSLQGRFLFETFPLRSPENLPCPASTLYIGVDPEHSHYKNETGSAARVDLNKTPGVGFPAVRKIAEAISTELIDYNLEHSVRFFEHEDVMNQELTDFYLKSAQEK